MHTKDFQGAFYLFRLHALARERMKAAVWLTPNCMLIIRRQLLIVNSATKFHRAFQCSGNASFTLQQKMLARPQPIHKSVLA
jgi:hypothetical protein